MKERYFLMTGSRKDGEMEDAVLRLKDYVSGFKSVDDIMTIAEPFERIVLLVE